MADQTSILESLKMRLQLLIFFAFVRAKKPGCLPIEPLRAYYLCEIISDWSMRLKCLTLRVNLTVFSVS